MGCAVKTREEFDALCAMREAEGIVETPESTRTVYVRPHGVFILKENRDGSKPSLSFFPRLPKIPRSLLEDVIAYFREDLSLEAAVRICWDEEKERYFFVRAGGSVGGAFIKYDFSDCLGEILRDGVTCVMDVHSHNRMAAFWSCVDDADELMAPGGLYGVIGRLHETPQMRLRATWRGSEVALDPNELFEDGRKALADVGEAGEEPVVPNRNPADFYLVAEGRWPFKPMIGMYDASDLKGGGAKYPNSNSLREKIKEFDQRASFGEKNCVYDLGLAYEEEDAFYEFIREDGAYERPVLKILMEEPEEDWTQDFVALLDYDLTEAYARWRESKN